MKRFFKIVALALCIALLGVTLCSCRYLDEAKANTAVYDDESMDSLTFRGYQYRKVDLPNGLGFIISESKLGCSVTLPDVPVLLSGSFGDSMYYDAADEEHPAVIRVNGVNINRYDSRLEAALADDYGDYTADTRDIYTVIRNYVREDRYEAVKKIVEKAELNHYCTFIRVFDDPTVPWEGSKYVPTLLDEATTEVIRRAFSNQSTVSWNDLADTEWYGIFMNPCDETLTLTDNNRFLQLLTNGNDYYLFYSDDVNRLYHVSDNDFQVMRKLYKMCENDLEYMDINYYRENADTISNPTEITP